ncbi:MAG: hypothetical protein IJ386_04705 [Clostridia bacterium]|nr:hypothetical protein [Clostridia bacterium]
MVSEKLDRVLAAEDAAAEKIRDAEKRAQEIINTAKAKAAESLEQRRGEAKVVAEEIILAARAECDATYDVYEKDSDAEAEKIARDAAKNEMFGINTVIMKIIP